MEMYWLRFIRNKRNVTYGVNNWDKFSFIYEDTMEKKIYKKITVEDLKNEIDVWDIAEPMLWLRDSCDSYEDYISSIDGFTLEQRYLCAILIYFLEVRNGGNYQFLANPSGMVWEDTLNGLKFFKMKAYADNLQKLIDYLGGSLPFDEDERYKLVSKLLGDKRFDDLLDEADTLVCVHTGEDEIIEYIRLHPEKFIFEWYYYED